MSTDPTKITQLYAQVPLEAMQQVSDSYMAWYVERATRELDETIAELRTELRENDAHEASFRPSPAELNAIERLQRAGVTSMDLLDRMVEQGEEWLMLTMRRLDHFEQTGLAPKDYSIWCEHALSGAYDWIDHDRLASTPRSGSAPAGAGPGPAPAGASAQTGRPPEWLVGGGGAPPAGGRGGAGGPQMAQDAAAQPQGTAPAAAGERPTQPVPSVAPRWGETSYPGVNTGAQPAAGAPAAPGAPGAPAQTDPGNESGRRNIFRIFTS
jgi:hypothetical protein